MRLAAARVAGIPRALTFAVHDELNDRHVSERIATEGVWEPFETELIRRFLSTPVGSLNGGRRNHLFVDCGANLGWYSVVAGALGADVVAFEPLPANAALLRSNVRTNNLEPFVEVHEMALGSNEGSGSLRLSVHNQGDHRLVPGGVEVPTAREEVTVTVRRLDDVLAGRVPTVMKLDTQGSEVAILRGGRSSWTSDPVAIVLEFWPYGLERCGTSASDLLELLGPLIDVTHACYEIVEWRGVLTRLSLGELTAMATTGGYSAGMKGFTNLVLVPLTQLAVVADLVDAPPGVTAPGG